MSSKDKRWVALEIAQFTGSDWRTVSKWLDGKPVGRFQEWGFSVASKMLRIESDVSSLRGTGAAA